MPKVDSNNFISNQFQENIVENKQNSISKGTEENKQSNKSKIENNNSKQGTNDNKTQKNITKNNNNWSIEIPKINLKAQIAEGTSKDNKDMSMPITKNDNGQRQYNSQVVYPIISNGDTIGSVILMSKDANVKMTDVEKKVAQSAATFLGSQMEI